MSQVACGSSSQKKTIVTFPKNFSRSKRFQFVSITMVDESMGLLTVCSRQSGGELGGTRLDLDKGMIIDPVMGKSQDRSIVRMIPKIIRYLDSL